MKSKNIKVKNAIKKIAIVEHINKNSEYVQNYGKEFKIIKNSTNILI